MKVLFVLPDVRPELVVHNGSVFEGVAYLSVFLKNAGHECVKFQPTEPVSHEPLIQLIEREKPDVIAYSAVTNMIKYVERWAPEVKRRFAHVLTVCGGVHATAAGESTLQIDGIDAICVGEGEFALTDLCNRLEAGTDYHNVPSMWFKRGGEVVRNPVARLIPSLDDYPFPDLDLFRIEDTFYYKNRFATMKLSRGCPLPCTYCCNKMFMDTYPSDYVRYRSPENSIQYIRTYLSRYPNVDAIAFLDDILPMKMEWFREFSRLYRKEIGLPYTARCLVSIVKDEVIELLADSGCYEVTFGVEAGNEEFRSSVLKRKQSDRRIIEAFHLCAKHGITTRANMMVGLPYETPANVLEGIRLCAKLKAKFFIVSTFFPTPATELFDLCIREGYIGANSEIPDSPYNMNSALVQPSIEPAQVEFYRLWYVALVRLYACAPSTFHPWIDKALSMEAFPYEAMNAVARVFLLLHRQWWRLLFKLRVKHYRYRP
jgi:anaerobic magnesium-protoporphyrin IX monomethyl ester cyclase